MEATDEKKLSLLEHLSELRTRLWRVVLAVLALGILSLSYAREIFAILMKPVLAALPEEGRALVYTSGIEEINVLLKVGLYAGIFLAAPVALYQLWQFVAPGLLSKERRMVGPFVTAGTLFFVGGALFCYFAILPSMFKFLLNEGDTADIRERISASKGRADSAARLMMLGEAGKAVELARAADDSLSANGEGKVADPAVMSDSALEVRERLTRFGRLLDAAVAQPVSTNEGRKELSKAVLLHEEATRQLEQGQTPTAAVKLEDAKDALRAALPGKELAFDAVWKAHRHLAAAQGKLGQEEWTRPMLSMKEQLSLVLLLEVAFGLIFELPLIMSVLAMIGLLKFRWVAKYQRHAILACVVVAAIVTPTGDVINLSLMAVPMIVCYELGVVLVWIFERRRSEREAQEEKEQQLAEREDEGSPAEP